MTHESLRGRGAAPKRVLIVDDDPEICALLSELLSWEGFQPSACNNGEQALELLRRVRFDALVTDQVMSGMTGVELARRAVDMNASLRCVVLSGYAPPEGVEVTWVRKPIDMEALTAALGSRPS
jgi:CheY-like chemotaxis protein